MHQSLFAASQNQFEHNQPTKEEVQCSAAYIVEKHDFPQCIGAIDCTHVGIVKLRENPAD